MAKARAWVLGSLLLVGAAVGAALMAPVGAVIIDGGPGCERCGNWTVTLIGWHVRASEYSAMYPILGAAAGLVIALILAMAWRLITTRRARASV